MWLVILFVASTAASVSRIIGGQPAKLGEATLVSVNLGEATLV